MAQKNSKTKLKNPEHFASASALNLPISTKHSIEISRYLRYKTTAFAKNFLENVIALKKAVPFRRFNRDMGHKAGMAAGRFPQKAAKEFLRLIKSVEANAQFKGLNTSNLKIIRILANKASVPVTGGRHRRGTKRASIEIEVKESKAVKKGKEKQEVPKEEKKKEAKEPLPPAKKEATEEVKEKKEEKTVQGQEVKPEIKEKKETPQIDEKKEAPEKVAEDEATEITEDPEAKVTEEESKTGEELKLNEKQGEESKGEETK